MLVSSLMPLFAQKKTSFWFYCGGASGLPPPRFSPQLCWRWMWSFSVGFDDQRCRLNWRKLIVIPSDLSPRGSPPTLCWSWMWSSSVGFDDQRFQSYLTWIAACLACILSQRCWFSFSLSDIAKPLVIALSVRVTCTSAARWCCCSCCAAAAFVSCVEKMAFDRC